MTKVAQYVGVIGITAPEQAEQVKAIADTLMWPSEVRLMVSPLASDKTFDGLEHSRPARYPPLEALASLLIEDRRFFNVIHLNSRRGKLAGRLGHFARLSPHLHGIQLNMAWPLLAELKEFRCQRPDMPLILQVGRRALKECGSTPEALVEALWPYEGLIEYVLIDPSGGEGIAFDKKEIQLLLEALVASELPMKWAVTGGLNTERCSELISLLRIYPTLSWDAESGLRTEDDAFDIAKCRGFLESSRLLLG